MTAEFEIKTGKEHMKAADIHRLLKETYWGKERTEEAVRLSLEHSVCAGAFEKRTGRQIGFVRAITDFSTVYYVLDMVVDPEARNQGIGRRLMETLTGLPQLEKLRGILITKNPVAEKLYESLGFIVPETVFMDRKPR